MKIKNKKGFTLFELLATIAIAGLVMGISIYTVNKIINSSTSKSEKIAINNLKTSANNYIKEYFNEVVWTFNESTNLSESCISLDTLISKGYISKNNEEHKSIILTKDENNVIISEEVIDTDCNSFTKTIDIPLSKNICNNFDYNGEGHNLYNHEILMNTGNYEYIKYKDNSYNETSLPVNAGEYDIEFKLNEGLLWKDNTKDIKTIKCSIKKAIPTLKLEPNGNSDTKENIGSKKTYLTSEDVSGTISIKSSNNSHAKIEVSNKFIEKGVAKELEVKTLSTRKTPTYITITLTPDDPNYKEGEIVYIVGKVENKTLDKPTCKNQYYNGGEQNLVDTKTGYILYNNKQEEIGTYQVTARLDYGYTWKDGTTDDEILTCEIKRPTPTITYNNNSGSGCSTKVVTYESPYGTLCTPTRTGYTFEGWYTDSGLTKKIDSNTKVTNFKNHNIYAKWKINKIFVQYHVNGGTWNGTHKNYGNNNGYITLNNSTIVDTFNYGELNVNPHNYNNPEYINITKTGYTAKSTQEWNTKSDGSGTSFNQTGVNANDLCDASKGNCTITLYVNWKPNKIYVKYHVNGGNWIGTNKNYGNNNGYITLNNSTIVDTFEYGKSADPHNYNNSGYINIKRTGYTAKSQAEWNTKSDGSGTSFNQTGVNAQDLCDASKGNCTVTLYVNWTPNKIKLTFNQNNGSGGMSNVWYYYGINKFYSNEACTNEINSITKPTRSGYTFVHYYGDGTSGGDKNERYAGYDNTVFASDLCTDIYTNATLTAQWVDNIAPTCSIAKNNSNSTSGVNITVTCSDSGSGCKVASNNYDNLKSSQTYTVYDNAGNTGSCKVDISSITEYRQCSSCIACNDAGRNRYCTCNGQGTIKDKFKNPPGVDGPNTCNNFCKNAGYYSSSYYYTYKKDCSKCGCSSWGNWTTTACTISKNKCESRTKYN